MKGQVSLQALIVLAMLLVVIGFLAGAWQKNFWLVAERIENKKEKIEEGLEKEVLELKCANGIELSQKIKECRHYG